MINVEGFVKWFNNEKGYGFINVPNTEDIFVHFSSIIGDGYRSLHEGDHVIFELLKGEKGLQAKNVEKI